MVEGVEGADLRGVARRGRESGVGRGRGGAAATSLSSLGRCAFSTLRIATNSTLRFCRPLYTVEKWPEPISS